MARAIFPRLLTPAAANIRKSKRLAVALAGSNGPPILKSRGIMMQVTYIYLVFMRPFGTCRLLRSYTPSRPFFSFAFSDAGIARVLSETRAYLPLTNYLEDRVKGSASVPASSARARLLCVYTRMCVCLRVVDS